MKVSLLFNSASELLEGPIFDTEHELLYFVSILDGLVHCYDPKTKEIGSVQLGSPVGCVFVLSHKRVLAASKEGFYEVDFNTLQKRFAFQMDIGDMVRYNDGILDPKGRFLVGTMGYPDVQKGIGNVYSYDKGTYQIIIENTTISNGLAFSKDGRWLYFIDTPTKKVAKYHYDMETGQAVFDSHVIEITGKGVPDGMCMDGDGMLWIAEWGGYGVSKWNPATGVKLETIELPSENVTSCCLDNKGNLYVTSAKSDPKKGIHDGGLFYVHLNEN